MNKNRKYTVDFFLTDETFIDWARGKTINDIYWETWITNNPESLDEFNEAKFIASELNFSKENIHQHWVDTIKEGIDAAIDESKLNKYSTVKTTIGFKWQYVAASLFLAIGISVIISYFASQNNPSSPAYYTRETSNGQKLSFYLNDGTKVKLNSATTLKYSDFSDTSRAVYLEGEAFFDVVRDTLRPFTIITQGVKTQVLGTSFTINSNPDTKVITVALLTGKVLLSDNGSNNTTLSPGQVARSVKNRRFEIIDEDVTRHTSWKDGIIVFNRASMDEVIEKLSSWYGVEFIITGNAQKREAWEYTGSFDNQSLQVVLMSLSYVKKFDYEIKDKSIFINY